MCDLRKCRYKLNIVYLGGCCLFFNLEFIALLISVTPSLPAPIHLRILSCSVDAFKLSLKSRSGFGVCVSSSLLRGGGGFLGVYSCSVSIFAMLFAAAFLDCQPLAGQFLIIKSATMFFTAFVPACVASFAAADILDLLGSRMYVGTPALFSWELSYIAPA